MLGWERLSCHTIFLVWRFFQRQDPLNKIDVSEYQRHVHYNHKGYPLVTSEKRPQVQHVESFNSPLFFGAHSSSVVADM